MPCFQFVDVLENGFRGRDIKQRKIIAERFKVEGACNTGIGDNGFNFRTEDQGFAVPVIIQGLDAEAIPRHEEAPSVFIPNGKGKHPSEAVNTGFAPLFIGVNDGFGVAPGLKHMALVQQLLADVEVIVDLTIEHNPYGPVFIGQWLLPGGDIDDRQAPMRQTDRRRSSSGGVAIKPLCIRAAMGKGVGHLPENFLIDWLTGQVKYSAYSAHKNI